MNVIEQEAVNFGKFYAQRIAGLKLAKENLEQKLTSFTGSKNKLYFLNVLRKEIEKHSDKHKSKCDNKNCSMHRDYGIAEFAIDQELESISTYYHPEVANEDEFTIEQKVDLHNKINEVIEKLNNLGIGQEVIFNEIDELKEHFNLGKKNWFKLLKGKLLDLGIEKALEVAILDEIFKALSEGFTNPGRFLLK